MKNFWAILFVIGMISSCNGQANPKEQSMDKESYKISKTDEEWRAALSPDEYFVLRQKGTERPGTGKYNLHFEEGIYKCAACNAPLFESDSKFDAHCGWPSFDKAINKNTVVEKLDKSHGMMRTEILCANCGSHLGHVFNDGPTETGLRYCINSVSLDFDKEKKEDKR